MAQHEVDIALLTIVSTFPDVFADLEDDNPDRFNVVASAEELFVHVIAATSCLDQRQMNTGQVCATQHLSKGISDQKEGVSLARRLYLGAENIRDTLYTDQSLGSSIQSAAMDNLAIAGSLSKKY